MVDLGTGVFSHVLAHPAIAPLPGRPGRHELALDAIRDRFLEICAHYHDRLALPFTGISLCSEMHGFGLLDARDRPVSPYVGWKDERSREPIDGLDTFSLVARELGPSFKALTGMRPRPGFPLVNLVHLAREAALPEGARLVSIPDWLARATGEPAGVSHATMLAGLAIYDVARDAVSDELLGIVRALTGRTVRLDAPAPAGAVAGWWRHAGRRIPIHVGVGDHQCTVLGAGLVDREGLSLNLGTGSQLAGADRPVADERVESRPYFPPAPGVASRLHCVTHIPAGRALAEYVGLLESAAESAGGEAGRFWRVLAELDARDVEAASLGFGLAVFSGAWQYADGGRITGIEEGRLTPRNYLASLLRAFVGQYREILAILDPGRTARRLTLSGGIARRLPNLPALLAEATGYEVQAATPLDESLLGLRALALVAAGRAPGPRDGQRVFRRTAEVLTLIDRERV